VREPARHTHRFLGEGHARNERRTRWVIALTAVTMVVEVAAGIAYGSMALLADGWHMATHAGALAVAAYAYAYARRRAGDAQFTFGTGKVGDLAGFASAVALLVISAGIALESLWRLLFEPTTIAFEEAIVVAVLGLVVNLVSAAMLHGGVGDGGKNGHAHAHGHDHGHHHGADHNLRAAYLHVVADALTSVLAIAALVAGRFGGWNWLDPAIGVLGAVMIARWSLTLMGETGGVLLDAAGTAETERAIRAAVEVEAGVRIDDLHVWRVGPGHLSAIVALAAEQPRPPQHYKRLIDAAVGLSHLTVEVNPRTG
jgi:cation diffusion facilitator family transporter